MKKLIKVEKHGNGFKAFLADDTAKWEFGNSVEIAVAKLVESRQAELGVSIDYGNTGYSRLYFEATNHTDYDLMVKFFSKHNVEMLDRRKDVDRILVLAPPGLYDKMLKEVSFQEPVLPPGDEPVLSNV